MLQFVGRLLGFEGGLLVFVGFVGKLFGFVEGVFVGRLLEDCWNWSLLDLLAFVEKCRFVGRLLGPCAVCLRLIAILHISVFEMYFLEKHTVSVFTVLVIGNRDFNVDIFRFYRLY